MTMPVPPSTHTDRHRVRVLIVDDMPQVLHDLHQLLELTGQIEVVAEATSGEAAIRLAAEHQPEVVVMDLEMPGMDGYETTRQIKDHRLSQRVVILSIHAGRQEQQRARAAGADGFITKGASYEILVDAILAEKGEYS